MACYPNENDGIGPNFPFYDGPFPPAAPQPDMPQEYEGAAYGFFYQAGRLAVAPGMPIPFGNRPAAARGLRLCRGEITLPCAGSYMIAYSMAVPENYTLETELYLTLNGATVLGSVTEVDKTDPDGSMVSGGQAIVRAPAGAALSLITSNGLNITANEASDTLVSMTVRRID